MWCAFVTAKAVLIDQVKVVLSKVVEHSSLGRPNAKLQMTERCMSNSETVQSVCLCT